MAAIWRTAIAAAACAVLLAIIAQTSQDALQRAVLRWPAVANLLPSAFQRSWTLSPPAREDPPAVTVWWFAPFFSGGGYSSEALAFVLGLHGLNSSAFSGRLKITQHGDGFNTRVWQGLPPGDRADLARLANIAVQPLTGRVVTICHSEPGAWALPEPLFQTSRCPPPGLNAYRIGRTMFETDRLSAEHARRINAMNEVWVPTAFQRDVFNSSGVHADRIHIVPEPIDVDFFSPSNLKPLHLSGSELVFGSKPNPSATKPFIFVSVFKWEARKGWDVLLQAFLSEFNAADDVEIYLLTNAYHTESNFKKRMRQWANEHLRDTGFSLKGLPRVYLVSNHVPQVDLPRFYLAADAFVLPSRGEGWGRPHVEAMSMGLPVIATNWSGPTAFLDKDTGYPLHIDGLETITEPGAFQGHKWASPSVPHLRQLMRHVVEHPEEARRKGAAARESMVRRFAPAVVAELVAAELRRVAVIMQGN